MRARLVDWVLALIAGLAVAAITPETLFPGSRLIGFMATIVGAMVVMARVRSAPFSIPNSREERLPDGKVDIARVIGLVGEPNRVDPRFSRFLRLEQISSETPRGIPRELPIASRCPSLLGRIVVFSVFLDSDRNTWSPEEVARSHQAILRAGVWMERQAAPLECADERRGRRYLFRCPR